MTPPYVAEILDQNDERLGFGVHLGHDVILTLYHVVGRSVAGERRDDEGNAEVTNVKVRMSEGDFAVRRLIGQPMGGTPSDGPFPDEPALLLIANTEVRQGTRAPIVEIDLESAASEATENEVVVEVFGVSARDSPLPPNLFEPMRGSIYPIGGSPLFQFRAQDTDFSPGAGTSGSPVIDMRGRVVGLLQAVEVHTERRAAYVSPIAHLKAVLDSSNPGSFPRPFVNEIHPSLVRKAAKHGYLDDLINAVTEHVDKVNRGRRERIDFWLAPVEKRGDPEVSFRAVEGNATDRTGWLQPEEWMNCLACGELQGRVFLLQARGGAGKTNLILDMLKVAESYWIVPFYIDAAKIDQLTDAGKLLAGGAPLGDEIASALRRLVPPYGLVKYDEVIEQDGERPLALLMVDGLNEARAAANHLLSALFSLCKAYRWIKVFVADRTLDRQPDQFSVRYTIPPLCRRQISAVLDSNRFPHPFDDAAWRLLSTPILLFLVLSSERPGRSVDIKRYIDAFETFFRRAIAGSTEVHPSVIEECLSKVAHHAYQLYSTDRPLQFPHPAYERLKGILKQCGRGEATNLHDSIWEGFDTTALIRGGGSHYQYRHQLLHDFLVGRHLADTPQAWNDIGFDTATWESQNPDPLIMAAERAEPRRGVELLQRVYDWNYLLMIQCVHRLSNRMEEAEVEDPAFDIMKDQLAALMAMKLRDPFTSTRTTATSELEKLEAGLGKEALQLSRKEILDCQFEEALKKIVRQRFSAVSSPGVERWSDLFCASELPTNEINLPVFALISDDSLTGWTAANAYRRVARRTGSSADFFNGLVRLFQAMWTWPAVHGRALAYDKETDEAKRLALHPRVVMRRLAYLFGSSDEPTVAQVLTEFALTTNADYHSDKADDDFYRIVRDDALRSLMEIAARRSGKLRRQVLGTLERSLKSLHPSLRARIMKSSSLEVGYIKNERDWQRQIKPLRRMIEQLDSDTR